MPKGTQVLHLIGTVKFFLKNSKIIKKRPAIGQLKAKKMQTAYGKSSAESFVVIVVGRDRVAVSPHGRPARRLPHPCVAGRNVNKMTLKRFVLINDLSVAGNGVA